MTIYSLYQITKGFFSPFAVVSVKMKIERNNNLITRKALNQQKYKFVDMEGRLRKMAYEKTELPTDESFFNDQDMSAEYYLILVYNKKTDTPLLSARLYHNPHDLSLIHILTLPTTTSV